jgi:hypothetical protein
VTNSQFFGDKIIILSPKNCEFVTLPSSFGDAVTFPATSGLFCAVFFEFAHAQKRLFWSFRGLRMRKFKYFNVERYSMLKARLRDWGRQHGGRESANLF